MPIRLIMRYLLNNEQLVQRLAESYPIRRAAQITAFLFHRGRQIGHETMEQIEHSDISHKMKMEAKQAGDKASTFSRTFSRELSTGFRDLQRQIKENKPK